MPFLVRANAHVMCKAESLEEADRFIRSYMRMWWSLGGDGNVLWNIVEVKDCRSS